LTGQSDAPFRQQTETSRPIATVDHERNANHSTLAARVSVNLREKSCVPLPW